MLKKRALRRPFTFYVCAEKHAALAELRVFQLFTHLVSEQSLQPEVREHNNHVMGVRSSASDGGIFGWAARQREAKGPRVGKLLCLSVH